MTEHNRKNSWEQFFEYWDKEADEIRKTMLTPDSCHIIFSKFENEYIKLKNFVFRGNVDLDTHTRFIILKSKLTTSLQIARTKYLDKHPPLSFEKFMDALGSLLNKLLKK